MNRILQRAAADRRTLSRPTKERPTKGRQEEATLGFRQARSCARDAAPGVGGGVVRKGCWVGVVAGGEGGGCGGSGAGSNTLHDVCTQLS